MTVVMDTVKGLVINRRTLVRGGLAAASLAATATLAALLGKPREALAAWAPGAQAQYNLGYKISYGDEAFTTTMSVTVDGQTVQAYCAYPSKPTPSNSHTYTIEAVNPVNKWNAPAWTAETGLAYVRRALWFGWGGPGFDPSVYPSYWYDGSAMSANAYYVWTHLMVTLGYLWDGGAEARWGLSAAGEAYFDQWSTRDLARANGFDTEQTVEAKEVNRQNEVPSSWTPLVFNQNQSTQPIIFAPPANGKGQLVKSSANTSWL